MKAGKGKIAIMGSGELTSTMVKVHETLLKEVPPPPRPVFLDTPAGFQLNVDQLSKKACDYFRSHFSCSMQVASFKSSRASAYEAEKAFKILREGNYFLVGPGSPTYAVRQWKESPVREILIQRIEASSCLVMASAAALTLGRFTLPVYEIYKVGEELHWVEGMDILGHFGLDLVVIPHWNNAEGGTHDTRFCYMGEPRFKRLEAMLPEGLPVLGLDEHTACILDFEKQEASIKGIGEVTLRFGELERRFHKGEGFPIEELLRRPSTEGGSSTAGRNSLEPVPSTPDDSFWQKIRNLEGEFHRSLNKGDIEGATRALMDLDERIWEAQADLENQEFISQGRELMRELMVLLGMEVGQVYNQRQRLFEPTVQSILDLRERFRQERQWKPADAIREALLKAGIVIEDSPQGPRWRLKGPS